MTHDGDVMPQPAEGTARILVGIDGSPASMDALAWAAWQAALTSSQLDLVMTWDWPPSYGAWAMPFPTGYDPAESVQKVLEQAQADVHAKYPNVEITIRPVQGHPAPVLVEASKGASLLVVGSRGHGEFVGMLIGSVSEYCASNANCPVLVHRAVL
jgi:nucleotide-binding universal stress UspA family protein